MFIADFFDFINTHAKKFRAKLSLLVLSSAIAGCFEFAGLSLIWFFVLLLTKNTLNTPFIHFENNSKTALFLGVLVAFIYILKDVFMIVHINFQNMLLADISDDIFRKNYTCFISQNYLTTSKIPPSDKLRILDYSITTVINGFLGSVLSFFANSIVALGIISYLFVKFRTTAILIGIFIFTVWFFESNYFKNRAKYYGEKSHLAERNKHNFILSTVNAQKDIIIYNKKDEFSQSAYKLQKNSSLQKRKIQTNLQIPTYITEIGVMGAFVLFVVLMLVNNYSNSELGAGLAALAAVILRIVPNINKIQNCLQGINSAKAELKWFKNITLPMYECKLQNKNTDKKLEFRGSIRFKNVNFCYEKDNYALKDINLTINKNEFIGIIGASGSGKTTLFNLICGLFEPSCGTIEADNTVLNSNTIPLWQNNISILSQDYSLPFETVRQNVTLEADLSKKTDKDKIIEALKAANIYTEINCDINRNINELSCGQRHRVALARVFYFNRDIIMLDEATSALDVQSENEVNKSIDAVKGKKTVIAIAHRLTTLKNSDRLIYMDKGKIIDTGTFLELENKHPSFKKLIDLSQF